MNRQEVLKICDKCSIALREQVCTLADFEASNLDTISLVPPCVIEQMEVLSSKKEVLSHVDNLAPLNEKIYDDNNIKQQKASGIENNELSVGKHGDRIMRFLSDHPGEEYNPTMIKKELGIHYNTITASLSRLSKEGKIWKQHRGFYTANCTLNRHQIQKIENEIQPSFHNLSIKIPKILLSGTFELTKNILSLSSTVDMKTTEFESHDSNPKQQKTTDSNEKYYNGEIQNISFDICPKQTLTLIEYSDNYMIMIQADDNPLSIREFFWMCLFLKGVFGEGASKAELVKIDINGDIPISLSPNQLTLENVHGACLAVYGKGNNTRVELRNFHPKGLNLGMFSTLLLNLATQMNGGK